MSMARITRKLAQVDLAQPDSKSSRQRKSLPRRRRQSTRRLEFQQLETRQLLAAAVAGNLAITEINYNPYPPNAAELAINDQLVGNDFEFIELQNVSNDVVELANVRFTIGLTFDFTNGNVATLNAGDYVLAVRNQAAFEIRYGAGHNIAGEFVMTGLSNGGEQLVLTDANNVAIHDFTYSNGGSFPGRANGLASTLEVKEVTGDYNDGNNFRNSRDVHGSPGALGSTNPVDIVINELVSHTDPPLFDSIELFNASAGPVNIGNWFLSDEEIDYFKFQIPANTMLGMGEYIVFDENDFAVGAKPFRLDGAHGDTAFLISGDASGNGIQFIDDASLPATLNGQSFGRWPGPKDPIVRMDSRTLGDPNSGPAVGPLVISEVMYAPPTPVNGLLPDDLEFIEIYNPQAFAVSDLMEWQLKDGISFNFATGDSIAARGIAVVVSFDPNDPLNAAKLTGFRQVYGIDATVKLVGPYSGRLRNEGEHVWLSRPDDPPAEEPGVYPHTAEDTVDYNDKAPWPVEANEGGKALARIGVGEWGNDSSGWLGRLPNPGSVALAFDDSQATNEGAPVTFDLIANDGILDHNGTTSFARQFLSINSVAQPANGSVVVQADNSSVRYSPTANFFGTDTFTYTVTDGSGGQSSAIVTVTVADVNDSPQAANDTLAVTEDTNRVFAGSTLTQNDTDLDDANLVVTNVSGASHGVVSSNGATITYAPDQNYSGSDNFTYSVSDQRGGTDSATVQVTIAEVNDDPVAANDTASGSEDTDLIINAADLLADDVDVENNTLTITATTSPTNGTLTAINANQFRYRPQSNYNGGDQFVYTISDGLGGMDTATVSLTIQPINDPPVASDDSRSTDEDQFLDLSAAILLQNDSDIDGGGLVLIGVAGSDVELFGAGNSAFVRYTPADNFFGTRSFTYTISDGNSATATASVTVTVDSVNDPPTVENDSIGVTEDSTNSSISVLSNDSSSPDSGETLSLLSATDPANGTATIVGLNIQYTPTGDFAGNDSFSYTVSDGNGGTATASVSVTVSNTNDPPSATNDSYSIAINTTETLDVADNDSISPDSGESLTVKSVTTPSQGGTAVPSGDAIVYTPPIDYSGPEQFSYTITDGNGGTDTATVTIDVQIPIWQNPTNRFDTDESGGVIPRDALLVVNAIIDRGFGSLPTDRNAPDAPLWMIDVNGNGRLDSLDAIQLINHLNFEIFGLFVRPIVGEGEKIDDELPSAELQQQQAPSNSVQIPLLASNGDLDETVELLARDQVEKQEELDIDLIR
jgi:hypothetical protein